MAIVVRYFSTAAAGAGDGTTWADRAQLVSGATWSSVITGFSFAGSDSLECRVGPGTHSPTAALVAGSFANPPSAANPLIFHGCDSSGNRLSPPDATWTADRALFDDSSFPVVATTTNIITFNLANSVLRMIKCTASGAQGYVNSSPHHDWCSIINSTANTSAKGVSTSRELLTNTQIQMTGSSYDFGTTVGSGSVVDNVKIVGVAGSSGNRNGVTLGGTNESQVVTRLCVSGVGGHGIDVVNTNAAQQHALSSIVIANCGGAGIRFASTASQTLKSRLINSLITGNGTYGIDCQSGTRLELFNCRFRDNATANINGMLNWPTDFDIYTTDSDDATEYMDAASNDFQVKTGLAWGLRRIGISEQAAASGGASLPIGPSRIVRA